jgi:cytochrome c oxidase cbb3-type subunit 2
VGGRYSDDWQRIHLRNPRDVVPESNMPAYPYLQNAPANVSSIQKHMRALKRLGVPYTDDEIANAPKELEGKNGRGCLSRLFAGLGS